MSVAMKRQQMRLEETRVCPLSMRPTLGVPLLLLFLSGLTACLASATPHTEGECQSALGMQSGRIPDEHVSASSNFDTSVSAIYARAHLERGGGAWCPIGNVYREGKEYLEVNLGSVHIITKVAVQGRFAKGQGRQFARHYKLQLWTPGLKHWVTYTDGRGAELLEGNTNTYLTQTSLLTPPVIATKLRFVPYSDDHPRIVCMRVELYGCAYKDEYDGSGAEFDERSSSHYVRKVTVGRLVRFKCQPENMLGALPGFVPMWYINDKPLQLIQDTRITSLNNRVWPQLRVKSVSMEDAGTYSCRWHSADSLWGWVNYTLQIEENPRPTIPQALHAENKILEDEATDPANELHVPVFTKDLKPLMIKPAGNVAELKCQARGPNLNFTWLKDGEKPIRQLGDVRIKGAMLKMENLVPTDSGNYTCIVSNEYGSINHTHSLEVIVHIASRPIFTKNLENVTVIRGGTVNLEVGIWKENSVMPYVMWKKDLPLTWQESGTGGPSEVDIDQDVIEAAIDGQEGGNITSSEDPQVLVLTNVTEEDAGWYTCIAANSLGTSTSTAYLNITDAEPLVAHPKESHLVPVMGAVLLIIMVVVSFGV